MLYFFMIRRSSLGGFVRGSTKSSSTSSNPPRLDYRSMVSMDEMPDLFASFDSTLFYFFFINLFLNLKQLQAENVLVVAASITIPRHSRGVKILQKILLSQGNKNGYLKSVAYRVLIIYLIVYLPLKEQVNDKKSLEIRCGIINKLSSLLQSSKFILVSINMI